MVHNLKPSEGGAGKAADCRRCGGFDLVLAGASSGCSTDALQPIVSTVLCAVSLPSSSKDFEAMQVVSE